MDPTKLIVTYAYEHNHSLPVTKSHSSSSTTTVTATTAAVTDVAIAATSPAESATGFPPEDLTVFVSHTDLDLAGDSAVLLNHHHHGFGWFDDVASAGGVLESPICGEVDDVALMAGEENEEESLFAGLGELPECSVVFRRRNIPSASAIQCGGITG